MAINLKDKRYDLALAEIFIAGLGYIEIVDRLTKKDN